MTRFDSGKALGFFWDVFKARPIAFLVLAAWSVAVSVTLAYIQYEPSMAMTQAIESVPQDDPAALMAVMGPYFGQMTLFGLIAIVIGVFLESAWLRLFLRGESTPIFPFRIGRDEGVYALTLLAWLGIAIGLYIGWIILAIIVGTVVMLALMGISQGLAIAGMLIAMFATALPFLWVVVRFSPSFALGILRGRFSLGESWTGTKGLFWPFFGCYFLAVLISIATSAVAFAVFLAFGMDVFSFSTGSVVASRDELIVVNLVMAAIGVLPVALIRGIAVTMAMAIDDGVADTNSGVEA